MPQNLNTYIKFEELHGLGSHFEYEDNKHLLSAFHYLNEYFKAKSRNDDVAMRDAEVGIFSVISYFKTYRLKDVYIDPKLDLPDLAPIKTRLNKLEKVVYALWKNKELVSESKTFYSFYKFFNSDEGKLLLIGSMTNALGDAQLRIPLEDHIEQYLKKIQDNNHYDYFKDSPEHKSWQEMSRKYSHVMNICGPLMKEIKVNVDGKMIPINDFCYFDNGEKIFFDIKTADVKKAISTGEKIIDFIP